jgi:NAD(P)H dehydrogenase (quinone)
MYLVTGASGHLGQAVINHLLTTLKVPASKIIAASRHPEKLATLKEQGITLRSADFDDESGLVKAFTGVDRVLLISTDAVDKPGRRLEQHVRAINAASTAGVGHVVYTSMPSPESSAVLFAPDHLGTEKALAASSVKSWTILRNNWYFENLFYSIPQALKSGAQYTATAQGKVAHIARDDLARAAASALASGSTAKTSYTLTGATAYTTDEIAKLVSAATGKPLNVIHVPVEGLIKGMVGAGLPEPMAVLFASFDSAIAKGDLSAITGDYTKLTGVKPQAFEDWLKKNAAALGA